MTDKELILTSLLDCRRVDLYVDRPVLSSAQQDRFDRILKRREAGEPLQYLIGFTEFMGLKFRVDERVLIPRPETEILVQAVIDYSKKIKTEMSFIRILDLGTGSGNIAISLAKTIPYSIVRAVDVSLDALEVAVLNARLNNVDDNVRFCKSDLFSCRQNQASPLSNPETLFDIIVANPPYIETEKLSSLPMDVRREPSMALDGGEDGLTFYRRIARDSHAFLKAGSLIFLEMGEGQKNAVEAIFEGYQHFKRVDCLMDLTNAERVLILEYKTNG
jgi:release factor glutamine methyltransferase